MSGMRLGPEFFIKSAPNPAFTTSIVNASSLTDLSGVKTNDTLGAQVSRFAEQLAVDIRELAPVSFSSAFIKKFEQMSVLWKNRRLTWDTEGDAVSDEDVKGERWGIFPPTSRLERPATPVAASSPTFMSTTINVDGLTTTVSTYVGHAGGTISSSDDIVFKIEEAWESFSIWFQSNVSITSRGICTRYNAPRLFAVGRYPSGIHGLPTTHLHGARGRGLPLRAKRADHVDSYQGRARAGTLSRPTSGHRTPRTRPSATTHGGGCRRHGCGSDRRTLWRGSTTRKSAPTIAFLFLFL